MNPVPTTATATAPATDYKAAAKARSLANLRPPWSKGVTGNPRGINGRGKANEIARFLDQPDSIESNRTRFEAVVDRLYYAARHGDTQAAKVLIEYKLGRPRVTPNALDLAEHFRRVEAERFTFGLELFRDRLKVMSDEDKVVLYQKLQTNTAGFLEMAEKLANGEGSQALQEAHVEAKLAEQAGQSEEEMVKGRGDDEAPGGVP